MAENVQLEMEANSLLETRLKAGNLVEGFVRMTDRKIYLGKRAKAGAPTTYFPVWRNGTVSKTPVTLQPSRDEEVVLVDAGKVGIEAGPIKWANC